MVVHESPSRGSKCVKRWIRRNAPLVCVRADHAHRVFTVCGRERNDLHGALLYSDGMLACRIAQAPDMVLEHDGRKPNSFSLRAKLRGPC